MPTLSELIAQHKAKQALQEQQVSVTQKEEKKDEVIKNPTSSPPVKLNLSFVLEKKSEQTKENLPGPEQSVTGSAVSSPPTPEGTAVYPSDLKEDVTSILMTGKEVIDKGDLEGFKQTLDMIKEAYTNPNIGKLSDPNLIINAMKSLLLELKAHPEFVKLLLPEHVGMLVRTLRESYGIAINMKTERSKKRKENKKDLDDFKALIGDIGPLSV